MMSTYCASLPLPSCFCNFISHYCINVIFFLRIVMCIRLYYASCFCIVDSIVLVPVIALIFLGMLLPLSWAITDDICKNSNKFVAAMNKDIRKILPVGFATEMHADVTYFYKLFENSRTSQKAMPQDMIFKLWG